MITSSYHETAILASGRQRLAIALDSAVNRLAGLPFEEVLYRLDYKCDGCLYNAICMYNSAERLNLSLVPYPSAIEKQMLRDVGIHTLPQLAALMELPENGSHMYDLAVMPEYQEMASTLSNQWPVGPNLPVLVAMRQQISVHIQFEFTRQHIVDINSEITASAS
jgi:hypothetical protein